MTAPRDLDDLRRRIDAFERELERRCAQVVEPTEFGEAYRNPAFPQRYSSNFVWVRRDLTGVDAAALARDAERALGVHGLLHRSIEIEDDANGPRLATAFLDLGWSAEALIRMVQLREPDRRPRVDVLEVDFATARGVIEENVRRQPHAEDEDVIRQLTEFRGVLEREAHARFFLGSVDGRPVAVCESYAIDGVAQVEDVNTLEEYRGRGVASSIVLAAAASARARGADLVFLVAAADDWPKELYRRLGFDTVSRFWSFTRTPGS